MVKLFDDDAIGSILQFAYLASTDDNSHQSEKHEWASNHFNPNYTFFWNGYIEAKVIVSLMSQRQRKEDYRAKINRVFQKLEHYDLIEPNPKDDDPNTKQYVITPLGIELYKEDSHREYVHGAKYIAEIWKNSVAKIYNPNDAGIGTGFLIEDGFLVTAKHVLNGLKSFIIEFENGNQCEYEEKLIESTQIEDLDVAILKLKKIPKGIRPFRLSTNVEILEEVVIFGYPPVPHSDDSYLVTNRGEVSSQVTLYRNQIQVIIVSSLLRGGNSGGPVVNRRGQVIGVVSDNLYNDLPPKERNINEGLAFPAAIGSIWIRDLISGDI